MAKKKKKYSRLSPVYLASRHAGAIFMFLTLGLLGGTAFRSLVQPTIHHAEAETAVRVVPADAAPTFDWEGTERDWANILRNSSESAFLSANLRYALKASATLGDSIDEGDFGAWIATLATRAEFAGTLFNNQFLNQAAARLGPTVSVGRSDIAPNMDFQSLAAIVADLDPPAGGAEGWDFSFFPGEAATAEKTGGWAVAKPGAGDRFFAVFFRLHEYLKGTPAPTPAAAWRVAVDELSGRLEREAGFTGGGGFGRTAKREIIREIAAIPVLAANGLYNAVDWAMNSASGGDSNADLWVTAWEQNAAMSVRRSGGTEGVLTVSADAALNPVLFRRDTAYTRIQPLMAATLIAYADAHGEAMAMPAAPKPAEPARETEPDFVDELEPLTTSANIETTPAPEAEPVPEIRYREVVDEAAATKRLAGIARLEETLRNAHLERDASLRALKAARDADSRISGEAVAARSRADGLHAWYDATNLEIMREAEPEVSPDTALFVKQRDEILARIATLLQYCTEEHPFVRQARRELAAVESQLSGYKPDEETKRLAGERAVRAANMRLEWETALEQADTLEERARRQNDEVTTLLDQVTEQERRISALEQELAGARKTPVPTIRTKVVVERPRPAAPPVAPVAVKTPAPKPTPKPVPAPAKPTPPPAPEPPPAPKARLEVAAAPETIDLAAVPPDFRALLFGLAAGCCLGLLWMILREVTVNRFRNEYEALRLTGLPVLASLPAYDARSFREAAKTVKGEATRARADAWQFIPAPVETSEPPVEARRGKIQPAAVRPRFLAWVFGLLFLLLGGLLYYKSMTGFAQPEPPVSGALSLPAGAIREWDEGNRGWGGELP